MDNSKVFGAIFAAAVLCLVIGIIVVVNLFNEINDYSNELDENYQGGAPDGRPSASDTLSEEHGSANQNNTSEGEKPALLGDINGDGVVDSSDASLILEYYGYTSTMPEDEQMTMEEYLVYRSQKRK